MVLLSAWYALSSRDPTLCSRMLASNLCIGPLLCVASVSCTMLFTLSPTVPLLGLVATLASLGRHVYLSVLWSTSNYRRRSQKASQILPTGHSCNLSRVRPFSGGGSGNEFASSLLLMIFAELTSHALDPVLVHISITLVMFVLTVTLVLSFH